MAKFTLTDSENGLVRTIITDSLYIHDMPCIGDDGMMYNFHKIWNNEKHFHSDKIILIDEEQGFFLSINRGVNDEHLALDNFQKSIFDKVKSIDEYILVKDIINDTLNARNKEIRELIMDNVDFSCVHGLFYNHPEDFIESRTSWEDLKDYLSGLFYLIGDIYDIVE